LVILDEEKGEARVVDYKTGKSTKYADTGQLELMALAVFKHFNTIKKVKAGLLFVIAKELVKENYHVDNQEKMWVKWLKDHDRLKASYANDVWNPRPSGLCRKHCVVTSCPHNGANL
jgi:RecB family exonuclease